MFNFLRNKNYNYIAQKFNDIGIYLDKNSYLDLKDIVWEEILFVLKDLMNIYPIIPIGFLSEINTKKYDNIASIGFIKSDDNINYDVSKGLQLRLNTFYFSNKKNFENNIYDSNLAGKRFDGSILTNDDYIKVGISHEFGHTIDVYKTISYLGLYNVKLSENKAKAFFKHINYSQSIIPNEIYKLYPKKNPKNISIESELSELINSTASVSVEEAFAEIISLDYCGIQNDFVQKIINIIKES